MKKQLVLGILCLLFVNLTSAASVCLNRTPAAKNAPGEAVNAGSPNHPPHMHQAPGEADKTMESVDTVPMGHRTNNPLSSGPSLPINGQ